MNIQWYPGHIAKATKEIKKKFNDIDVIIQILDARCPITTKDIFKNELEDKNKLLILNKSDLSDPKKNKLFIEKFFNPNQRIIALDSRKNSINNIIDKNIFSLCKDLILKNELKNIKTVIKAMVIGMPNVGKSTFINSYMKKKVNDVQNKPGVTKNLKWTTLNKKVIMLDTPGITIPKFNGNLDGIKLLMIGSINETLLNKQDLIFEFLNIIKKEYIDNINKKYNLNVKNDIETLELFNLIALKKNCIKKNKSLDYEKTATMIYNDFKNGSLGLITLDEI